MQQAKQATMDDTTIKQSRRQKLQDSLKLLTHDAEKEKSFASKAALGQIFKQDAIIDVNTAFALTNQIKLARVFEMTSHVLNLSSNYGVSKEIKDLEVFKAVLYKTMSTMTLQRLRELRDNTRRLVYKTKLALAKALSNSVEFTRRVESSLAALDKYARLEASILEDVEAVVGDCKISCSSMWNMRTKSIDTSILDAPDEQDLCDVGKPFQPPMKTASKLSAVSYLEKPTPRPVPTATASELSTMSHLEKAKVPPRPTPRSSVLGSTGASGSSSSSLLLEGASSYTPASGVRPMLAPPTARSGAGVQSSGDADEEVRSEAGRSPSGEALANMSLDEIMGWVRSGRRSLNTEL